MSNNNNLDKRPHIVIVGAGFGGLAAAKEMVNTAVDITLIDRRNYHLFQPLLYQVATAELSASEIAIPIRHIFEKAENLDVFMESVVSINADSQIVSTENDQQIHYDYLILATGAKHSYFGKDEWAQVAPGLKSIEDAYLIRNRILTAFENAEITTDPDIRQAYLTFVIVGGGPTGVELAGALAELAKKSLKRDFRHISPESSRIILVDAGTRLLAAFHEDLSQEAQKDLQEMGVEVFLHSKVAQIDANSVQIGDQIISSKTVIWAAGVEASPAGKWLGVETDRSGHVSVNENLEVPGFNNIFAIGDTASFLPKDAERPLPGIASVAKQQGHFVGKFILAKVLGKTKLPVFRYLDLGSMATIGRNNAVVDLKGFRFSGIAGWLLWCSAHIYFLIGFRNRLLVASSWFWNYLSSQRSIRLILGATNIFDNKI